MTFNRVPDAKWKENLYVLDTRAMQHPRMNTIAVHKNETIGHFLRKCEIAYDLHVAGKRFYTEAIFRDGAGRADIYIIDDKLAIEILKTEKEENNTKPDRYPCRVVFTKATDTGFDPKWLEE